MLIRVILLLALAGCQSTPQPILDKPRAIEVKVPGPIQKIDAALVADCAPAPLGGTTVGDELARQAAVEDCLKQMRDQAAKVRALKP